MNHTRCPRPPSRRLETTAALCRTSGGRTPLIIRTCCHILDHDRYCQAAAMRGRRYCAAHLRLRERRWRMARAHRRMQARFRMPDLVDRYAVRLGIARVRVALAGGLIEKKTASLMLYGLRIASSALRYQELRDEYAAFLEEEREIARRLAAGPNFHHYYHIEVTHLE